MPRRAAGVGTAAAVPEAGVRPRGGVTPPLPTEADAAVRVEDGRITAVKGDPDQRRRYLDDLLVASRPRYAAVRADYERVVKQRTALLKSARAAGRACVLSR